VMGLLRESTDDQTGLQLSSATERQAARADA